MDEIRADLHGTCATDRRQAPASLVCSFTAGILGSTAILSMNHPDPTMQKTASALFFLVSSGSIALLFLFLWYKPEVFQKEVAKSRGTRSGARRQPCEGKTRVDAVAESEANLPSRKKK